MGASLLGIPEMNISEAEAEKLAEAINEVGQFHNVKLDPEVQAWVNLAIIAGGIYGTRAMAVKIRKEAAKRIKLEAAKPEAEQQQQQRPAGFNAPIFSFPGSNNPI